MVDEDVVEQIRIALEDSDRVDARRIAVDSTEEEVVLQGAVASPEEGAAAAVLAEGYWTRVVNRLQVDVNLREGAADPVATEPATPAENEVLIGSTDMLSGPESTTETDMSRALEENLPWEPPTEPHMGPTDAEYAGAASDGTTEEVDTTDPAPDEVDRADYAAADLSQEELNLPPERVPSLDPEGVVDDRPTPDPVGVDSLGATPPEGADDFPEPVPGGGGGSGATGEGTAGGGSVADVPATESGAAGADTAAADPARAGTGGTMTDAGTHRGPQSREDEALREDFPEADPPDAS